MPVRFYLYPVANKHNEFPIRVSLSVGSTRYMTGIGYNCSKEAWEEGHGVKPRYTNTKGVSSKIINAAIAKINPILQNMRLALSEHLPKQTLRNNSNWL